MSKNILITGGTGLVGSELKQLLENNSYDVRVLSRQKLPVDKGFRWDPESGFIDAEALQFADVVIHLAGENVAAKKWTKAQKEKIVRSRVQSSDLLKNAIRKSDKKPEKFISASAVGFYGSVSNEKNYSETDAAGDDFLANTAVKWENAVQEISQFGTHVAILRIGAVMTQKGGALPKMLKPVKMFAATPVGSGNQYVPWIALTDLVRMFLFALENDDIKGVYNAVSPILFTNKEFMKELAAVYKKPFIPLGVPGFLMKLFFGEMSCILLEGSKISSDKIQKAGFRFELNTLAEVCRQ